MHSTLALLIETWLDASSCLKGLGPELLQGEGEEGDGASAALPGAWSVLPPKPTPCRCAWLTAAAGEA